MNTYPAAGRNARTPTTSQCSTRDQPWPLCSPMVPPRSGTLPHPRNDRGEHRGRRLCSAVNTGAVSHTRRHRVVAAMTRRCNLCYLARSCTSGHPGRGAGPAEGHTKCICMHVGCYIVRNSSWVFSAHTRTQSCSAVPGCRRFSRPTMAVPRTYDDETSHQPPLGRVLYANLTLRVR